MSGRKCYAIHLERSYQFSLIYIPVKLFSGSEATDLDFDMLCKDDMYPIRFVRVCESDGEEVEYKDIVGGCLDNRVIGNSRADQDRPGINATGYRVTPGQPGLRASFGQ